MNRLLIGAALCCLANAPALAVAADDLVEIRQSELQKFLDVLGTVGTQGGAQTTIGGIPYPAICKDGSFLGIPVYYPCIKYTSCTASYSWSVSVSNLALQIGQGAIDFTGMGQCQASAGICGLNASLSYSPGLQGALVASWAAATQEVWVSLQRAEVEIYVNPAGLGRVHLAWVDVANYLPKPLFKKQVPTSQHFSLPAPISRSFTAAAQNTALALVPGTLRLTTDVNFSSP